MKDVIIITQADRALLAAWERQAPLKGKLDEAIVVSSEAVPPDVVTMNSRVSYTDEAAGTRRTVTLVLPPHAEGSDRVSVLGPVGSALLGVSAGQTIARQFPDGALHRLTVNDVLHQPERLLNEPGVAARSA